MLTNREEQVTYVGEERRAKAMLRSSIQVTQNAAYSNAF